MSWYVVTSYARLTSTKSVCSTRDAARSKAAALQLGLDACKASMRPGKRSGSVSTCGAHIHAFWPPRMYTPAATGTATWTDQLTCVWLCVVVCVCVWLTSAATTDGSRDCMSACSVSTPCCVMMDRHRASV